MGDTTGMLANRRQNRRSVKSVLVGYTVFTLFILCMFIAQWLIIALIRLVFGS